MHQSRSSIGALRFANTPYESRGIKLIKTGEQDPLTAAKLCIDGKPFAPVKLKGMGIGLDYS